MNKRFASLKINEDDVVDMYSSGSTILDIRNVYHTRDKTISDILKKNNVTIKKTYQYYTSKELARTRKYYCKEDIFENIDNIDKAYWLGFLYADGNVYIPDGKDGNGRGIRIEITLKEEDGYHLENFSHFIESNYPVKQKIVKLNGKEIPIYRIAISSVKMGNDLIKHGCVPRKSLTLKYPNDLKEQFFCSFLAGYFDGDGCLSFTKNNRNSYSSQLSIMGTYEFLTSIKYKLYNFGIDTGDVASACSKAFILRISNHSHANFYNLIYNKSSYILGRKFEKFRYMLDTRNKDYDISDVAKIFRLL
jgi:hypothetical protein